MLAFIFDDMIRAYMTQLNNQNHRVEESLLKNKAGCQRRARTLRQKIYIYFKNSSEKITITKAWTAGLKETRLLLIRWNIFPW